MNLIQKVIALTIVLLTFGEISCTSSPAPASAQRAEEHKASLQRTRTQELEYLRALEKASKEEARNEAWAAQKESELRASFSAGKDFQNATLKSVECRSSKCDLQFQVSLEEKEMVEQRAAIDNWIAANQPCGYTMTTWPNPEQSSGEIRIFLTCNKQ